MLNDGLTIEGVSELPKFTTLETNVSNESYSLKRNDEWYSFETLFSALVNFGSSITHLALSNLTSCFSCIVDFLTTVSSLSKLHSGVQLQLWTKYQCCSPGNLRCWSSNSTSSSWISTPVHTRNLRGG